MYFLFAIVDYEKSSCSRNGCDFDIATKRLLECPQEEAQICKELGRLHAQMIYLSINLPVVYFIRVPYFVMACRFKDNL